jgi:hypothetical protein
MIKTSITNSTVVLETRVVCGAGGGPDKTILNTPRFLEGSGYHTLCAYMHPPGDPGFDKLREKARTWQAPLLSYRTAGRGTGVSSLSYCAFAVRNR